MLRGEREPHETLSPRPQHASRQHGHPRLQRPAGEGGRGLPRRHREPDEEGGGDVPHRVARLPQRGQGQVPALPEPLPDRLHVGLLPPGHRRRVLDELRGGHSQAGADAVQPLHQPRVAGHEPAPEPGKARALGEGVEGEHVPGAGLERTGGRVPEVDLGVGLVAGQDHAVAAAALGRLLQEGGGGHRAGRVVGVVDPQDRRPLPDHPRHRAQVGQEVVLRQERERHHLAAGRVHPQGVDRVGRVRHQHRRARPAVQHGQGEVPDRLLGAVGRDHLALRIHLHPEPVPEPVRGRPAERAEPGGPGVAGNRGHGVDQRPPDEVRGGLARVPHSQVDDRPAPGLHLLPQPVQVREGIGREVPEVGPLGERRRRPPAGGVLVAAAHAAPTEARKAWSVR